MPEWRLLMRRLVAVAGMVPVAGCAGTVVSAQADGAADVSVDAARPDVVQPDAAQPDAACAAEYQTGPTCESVVHFPCGVPAELRPDGGGVSSELCQRHCRASTNPPGATAFSCWVAVPDDAPATDLHCVYCAVGRRPEGLALTRAAGVDVVGLFFADVAALEAAAVPAFERLADDLERLGARRDLVARCRVAADDERRHTVMMGALARRFGCKPASARVPPAAPRSLEDLARENAVEGCVRETFGALVASWQSGHADDDVIAHAMSVIAEEETRHAALSWDLASWFDVVLASDARDRVREARDRALDDLGREVDGALHRDVVRVAGMPDAAHARRLFDGLRETFAG